jgi:hypothetical protein
VNHITIQKENADHQTYMVMCDCGWDNFLKGKTAAEESALLHNVLYHGSSYIVDVV